MNLLFHILRTALLLFYKQINFSLQNKDCLSCCRLQNKWISNQLQERFLCAPSWIVLATSYGIPIITIPADLKHTLLSFRLSFSLRVEEQQQSITYKRRANVFSKCMQICKLHISITISHRSIFTLAACWKSASWCSLTFWVAFPSMII